MLYVSDLVLSNNNNTNHQQLLQQQPYNSNSNNNNNNDTRTFQEMMVAFVRYITSIIYVILCDVIERKWWRRMVVGKDRRKWKWEKREG